MLNKIAITGGLDEGEYFPITSLHREDIRDLVLKGNLKLSKKIEDITYEEMCEIAEKMADAYCDDDYWVDLEIVADNILN